MQPYHGICPKIERALNMLTKRWTALIIHQLLNHPTMRFSELEQSIPDLSGKVLATRLKDMEQEGLIERICYREMPPRVEYRLTEKARQLAPVLDKLADWAQVWMNESI